MQFALGISALSALAALMASPASASASGEVCRTAYGVLPQAALPTVTWQAFKAAKVKAVRPLATEAPALAKRASTTTRRTTKTTYTTATTTITLVRAGPKTTDYITDTTYIDVPVTTSTYTTYATVSLPQTTSTYTETVGAGSTVVSTVTASDATTTTISTSAGFTPIVPSSGTNPIYMTRRSEPTPASRAIRPAAPVDVPLEERADSRGLRTRLENLSRAVRKDAMLARFRNRVKHTLTSKGYAKKVTCQAPAEDDASSSAQVAALAIARLATVTSTTTRVITRTSTKTTTGTGATQTILYPVKTNTVLGQPDSTSWVVSTSTITTQYTYTVFTSTVVPASTASSTSTVTAIPTYAACGANNIVSTIDGGNAIQQVSAAGTMSFHAGLTPSQCCVLCQQTPFCTGSAWTAAMGFGFCYTITSDTCNGSQFDQVAAPANPPATPQNAVGATYVISNGPCGQWFGAPIGSSASTGSG